MARRGGELVVGIDGLEALLAAEVVGALDDDALDAGEVGARLGERIMDDIEAILAKRK